MMTKVKLVFTMFIITILSIIYSRDEHAAPNASLMIPISNGSWQLTIFSVRTVSSLKVGLGGFSGSSTTYTPKEGYAFLLVDVNISKIDPTSAMQVSTDQIAILDANRNIHKADGGGWGENISPKGVFTVSREVGKTENSYFSFDGKTMSETSRSIEEPFSYVFIVRTDELNQKWQFQFQDIPLITFRLGDPVPTPDATECTALPETKLQGIQVNNLKAAQIQSGAIYQVWANNTLTTRLAVPDRGVQLDLCKGSTFHELKIAADGAVLLQASPQRGWQNLYIIEPDGKISSLVRNARMASGEFMPGTNYMLISVVQTGKDGKQLYLYDRKKGSMSMLYEGAWFTYRVFGEGILLLQKSTWDTAMGPVGKGELPPLKLAEGTIDDVTSDGKYLISSDHISNLDGSDRKEIIGGKVEHAVLSPDGVYLLFQKDGNTNNTKQVFVYSLATGASQPITPNGVSFTTSFSLDGKWAAIIGTFPKAETNKSKLAKQILYIYSMEKLKMVEEVHGEIVNYFFSPDNAYLAYTTKNEDEALGIYNIKLSSGGGSAIGQGIMTEWSGRR